MESYSKSYAFKVHRLIEACIKDLQWNYYFSVEWTKEGRILTLKTSRKSKYTFLICTILELILILPDLVLTPVLIKDNSEDISLILIPGLKWMSLWISVVLYQIPVYLYRHELAQFLNIFLKLDLSELAKEERRQKETGRVLDFLLFMVVNLVRWNLLIVTLCVTSIVGTSEYVNVYFYYLGKGHLLGSISAILIGYRCYASIQFTNMAGLVLSFMSCWIIVEMRRVRENFNMGFNHLVPVVFWSVTKASKSFGGRELYGIYKKCCLLQTLCNLSIGRAILSGITACCACLATTCIFILISYHHVLDRWTFPLVIGFTGIGLIFPTVVFEFSSRVTKVSEFTLTSLHRRQKTDVWRRKTLFSFRACNSRVGDFFSIKRTTLPLYFIIVINNVITLVFSFGRGITVPNTNL